MIVGDTSEPAEYRLLAHFALVLVLDESAFWLMLVFANQHAGDPAASLLGAHTTFVLCTRWKWLATGRQNQQLRICFTFKGNLCLPWSAKTESHRANKERFLLPQIKPKQHQEACQEQSS